MNRIHRKSFVWAALAVCGMLTVISSGGKADPPSDSESNAQPPAIKPIGAVGEFAEWATSLAFSPDGTALATGTYEKVQLWETESRQQQAEWELDSGYVKSVAISHDGRWLAAGSYQKVTLWDLENENQSRTLTGHRGFVTGIAFSPDGKSIATSSEDETVRLWDVSEGSEQQVIRGHEYPVNGVAFSPDGRWIASAAGDETRITRPGEVKLWNAETGEEVHTFPEHQRSATGVAFSPDSRILVSTSLDETVNVYDVESGEALGFFGGHARPTNSAVFAPDGRTVITGSGGRAKGKNEFIIWDRKTGEEWATVEGHEAKINAVAVSSDGKRLATAGNDKRVLLWDIEDLLTHVAQVYRTEDADEEGEAVAAADSTPEASEVADDAQQQSADKAEPKLIRVGIIGLDTSHAPAFAKLMNEDDAEDIAGCRVVAAYPKGSPDIESSVSRVPRYTEQMQEMGVEIVDSIDSLLEKVDAVLLETNDGRPHLEQLLPCLRAGKPVFIDKPIAGSLGDAVALYEAARRYEVPIFSSSSLRYSEGAQALRAGKIGEITGCDAYSPCSLEKTHPDLFWYGIHGVETLFTVMGVGCLSVSRTSTPGTDVAVGTWEGGRVGTFRGIRRGRAGYGGTAFGTEGIEPIGPYGGYRPLVVSIVQFFKTGEPAVSERETLEIYAFMEAADESKRQGGIPVTLESVLTKAREEAKQRLAELDPQ